jgi:hypothetical protein
MVFGFDPRKLIEEEKDNEKNKINEVLSEQEKFDKIIEEQNAKAKKLEEQEQKKGVVAEAFEEVKDILKEVNYAKKYGNKKYAEEKRKQDPDNPIFDSPDTKVRKLVDDFSNLKDIVGKELKTEFGGEAQAYTLATTEDTEQDEKEDDKPNVFDIDVNNVGAGQAAMAGILSGGIKIGAGFFQLGAMIKDAFAEDGIPVDEGNLAEFNRVFENSYLGMLTKHSEEIARERAIGRLTELGVQLYGGYKTIGKGAIKVAEKVTDAFNKSVRAYKKGRYIKATGNKNLYEAAKEVKNLNKLSKTQRFVAEAVGGGFGTAAVIYKAEDMGTLGDLAFDEGEYTAMNRARGKDAKDDALRQIYNKLKLGGEFAVPIIPIISGTGKLAKLIAKKSKDLAYSSSNIEQFVEKFISKPFRSRGPMQADEFAGVQRMEGAKESSRKIVEDYLRRFDKIIYNIEKKAMPAARASGLTDSLASAFVKFINQGKFVVKNNKIIPQGFSTKVMNDFMKTMTKDLKIDSDDAVSLMNEFFNVQNTWADFMNIIYKGKNVNPGKNDFVDLMNDRINISLSNEFKIFGDQTVRKIDEFVPAASVKNQVAEIFIRTAKDNGVRLSKEDAMLTVNDIIKNVRLDKTTNSPVFKFGTRKIDPMSQVATATKNIAENITGGGKFKPDKQGGLVQTEKDLTAFKKLFGNHKNAENIISNVTTDLATVAARDEFYNFIKQTSKQMADRGERAIVYDSYDQAVKAFPNRKIIDASDGLQVPSGLGKEAYTPPINGMFTTEEIAEGLINGSKDALSPITKSAIYQWGVLIPKGLVQAGKTVGAPFTHARNFSSGAITTVYLGNIAIPPTEIAKAIRTAYRTIQPQFLGPNRPGFNISATRPKVYGSNTTDPNKLVGGKEFIEEGGNSLYRFLLDEGMVNSSARAREVELLIADSAKTGFLDKVYKRLGTKTQKLIKGLQEAYIAEDDYWKVFNFFGESYRIRSAYENAIKKGLIKLKDVPGGGLDSIEILQMATKKVRDMLPNYNYVSPFVKGTRKSPLGNFVGWTSEQLRTFPNTLKTAIDETRDPIFAKMGYQRLAGMATTLTTLPPLAVWGFSQAYGFTEKKLDALREFLPSFSKNSTILPVYENGKYKYIDFSRGFFYETLTSPIQTIFSTIEMNPDKPLLPLVWEGTGRAAAKILEPFLSESIWMGGWLDLWARGGEDKNGTRVWNPEDDIGDKAVKALQHLGKTYSIGSQLQFRRVIAGLTGDTVNGVEYELSDELLGLLGFRVAPMDIEKSMNFKIFEFLERERNQRSLMYEDTRTGEPVSGNVLITQMIEANKKRYDMYNSMRRTIDAALFLGINEDTIRETFKRRNQLPLYNKIIDNEFKSMGLTKRIEKSFEYESQKYNIPNTVDDYTKDTLKELNSIMNDMPLNKPWRIKPEDWIKKDKPTELPPGFESVSQPLNTPMPAANNMAMNTQQKNPITNLTSTETALLSPTEKVIAGRT